MDKIGRYRVISELGRGAMGIVYKAQDPTIGRLVAIKTIRLGELTHAEEREQLRNRLFREAQSAGILNHPGIVTIYDIAEEQDLAYIAMEFVEGRSLEKILASGAIGDAKFLVSVATQTAMALDYAHSKGIIHRDIKPGNIMVTDEGVAKITDFGIARIASSKFTHTGTVMGTPSYMSPEQVRGAVVDGRSDMFSLGVVIYEMLTGEKPFTGDSITTIIFKIVSENPIPAKELNPSVGNKMNAVVMRSLAKEPAERFQTCREFAEALQAAALQTANLTPTIRKMASMFGETEASDPALVTQPDQRIQTPMPPPATPPQAPPTVFDPAPAAGADEKRPGTEKKLPPLKVKEIGHSPAEESAPLKPLAAAPPAPGRDLASKSRPRLAWAALLLVATGGGLYYWFLRPLPEPQTVQTAQLETPPPVERPGAFPPSPSTPPVVESKAPAKQGPAEGTAEPRSPGVSEAPPVVPPVPAKANQLEIQIVTAQPGARVVMNGDEATACTTPCAIPARPGRHNLLFTQAGHHPERREVQVGREPVAVNVALRPITGTVMVATSPVGASVSVDGKRINGRTPMSLSLPTGKHTILVTMDGHAPAEQTIEVTDDSLLTVRLTLPPQ